MDKRSCLELTHEEFSEHYLETQTPVIITDLVHKMTSVCWNLEHVKKVSYQTLHTKGHIIVVYI